MNRLQLFKHPYSQCSHAQACQNSITISKYLPVCLYEVGPLREVGLSPVTEEGPSAMSQTCSRTLKSNPSLPGSLLQQSLLIEKHFRKKFISLRSIKVRREDSCFGHYCLKTLPSFLLHESVADWALLSSKDSSSTVENLSAFTGVGSHPPPPPLPLSSLDTTDNYTCFYALLNQNAIS